MLQSVVRAGPRADGEGPPRRATSAQPSDRLARFWRTRQATATLRSVAPRQAAADAEIELSGGFQAQRPSRLSQTRRRPADYIRWETLCDLSADMVTGTAARQQTENPDTRPGSLLPSPAHRLLTSRSVAANSSAISHPSQHVRRAAAVDDQQRHRQHSVGSNRGPDLSHSETNPPRVTPLRGGDAVFVGLVGRLRSCAVPGHRRGRPSRAPCCAAGTIEVPPRQGYALSAASAAVAARARGHTLEASQCLVEASSG
jgi:hypothetical protein